MSPSRSPVLSTIGDPAEPAWRGLMEASHPDPDRPGRALVDLWRRSRGREALVLRGSVTTVDWYRDLVFALGLRHRRHRPRTLMTDATWEPTSRKLTSRLPWVAPLLPLLARALIRAVDGPHMHYAVLSEGERETFSRQWGIPRERVVFTPFPMTLYDEWDRTPTRDEGYAFAGGNSLRDYELLHDAVRGTGLPVRVASRWEPRSPSEEVVVGETGHDEFVRLLAGARVMVLPMEGSVRSAGQQTFLNAMVLGKPVVVTDGLGVRDYIEDGVTGVVVPPGDPVALREAVVHAMDPAHAEHYAAMGRRARARVLERFMPHHYVDHLLGALGYHTSGESR